MKNKNYVVNLGCRLNIYEGEIIKNHLKTNNLNNVTVINSCAVTEEAEKKVSYEIRKAKKNFPNNKIVVTGCAAQINTLKYKDCMMIVISHDRRFLNSVCTHMADLDYGEIRLYNGNYDDFMIASTLARETILNENAKKEAKIKELQSFVSRFSANASKAKQATSRANQINKIKLEDVKASSRVYPFIRFKQEKKIRIPISY